MNRCTASIWQLEFGRKLGHATGQWSQAQQQINSRMAEKENNYGVVKVTSGVQTIDWLKCHVGVYKTLNHGVYLVFHTAGSQAELLFNEQWHSVMSCVAVHLRLYRPHFKTSRGPGDCVYYVLTSKALMMKEGAFPFPHKCLWIPLFTSISVLFF